MSLISFALALVAATTGLSDADFAAAMRGEAPARSESFTNANGKSAGRGLGAIVVDRPIAEVWATVSRYEDKAEYTPRLESVTVLERKPALLRIRMEVDATLMTARYTAWFAIDEAAHAIHWKIDPTARDNSIADVDGEFRLFEVAPTRTLVVYRAYVDSGRMVPRSIQDYMAVKSIPNLLRAIKRRVESGGTWKK